MIHFKAYYLKKIWKTIEGQNAYNELDTILEVFGNTKINLNGGKAFYIDKNKLIKLNQKGDSMMLTKTKGSGRRK